MARDSGLNSPEQLEQLVSNGDNAGQVMQDGGATAELIS